MASACWQQATGNLGSQPGLALCDARFNSLGAAQHACLHRFAAWCGGIVQLSLIHI